MNKISSISLLIFLLIDLMLFSCSSRVDGTTIDSKDSEHNSSDGFFYGADMSYLNEMEDCGAVYKDAVGNIKDAYAIFKDEGANLVRYRLWHNPLWTDYSTLDDVKKSIRRAKNKGYKVLLDFHYSDTWADPGKQQIPAAWLTNLNNTSELSEQLYQYTYNTLETLHKENLSPDIVQVGNEINAMILQDGKVVPPIDWDRNAALINKGIQAVRDIATKNKENIEVMLHIAQPENGLWWFKEATQNGITDFDWIGLSYYPKWSTYTLNNIQEPIAELIKTHNKKLMIVETAYPFTLKNADANTNLLGNDALLEGYPATQQGQLDFLNALTSKIKDAGGSGIVYWEPAWVSTNCKTLWDTGSSWDNATLFDFDGKPTLGITFFNKP